MPGRNFSSEKYRYGFNGKEKDKDMNSLTVYDYGFRIYNPAIGKFLSVDPLTKGYPWYTPYQFSGDKPISSIDLDGLEEVSVISKGSREADLKISLVIIIDNQVNSSITQVKSEALHSIFSKGDETFYLDNLPLSDGKNSVFSSEISKRQFEQGGGFKANIVYNVQVVTLKHKAFMDFLSINRFNPKYSFLTEEEITASTLHSENGVFTASTSTPNNIRPNKDFWAQNTLNNTNPSIEELIAHDAGFHNMAGEHHNLDANGNAIYPNSGVATLESKEKGMIYPIHSNTLKIINHSVEVGGAIRDRTSVQLEKLNSEVRQSISDELKKRNNAVSSNN